MKQIDFYELSEYTVPARGYCDRIYLHWTGGRYYQQFADYHINIDGEGRIYVDGVFTDKKEHTWRRNTRAIGIALDCCYNASPSDLGLYPPTDVQLEVMAKVVAKLCVEIGIDLNYDVMSHNEIAEHDGYGLYSGDTECKWDLRGYESGIRARALEFMSEWQG